jgi:hypothetical protein
MERAIAWVALKSVTMVAFLPSEPEIEECLLLGLYFAASGVLRVLAGLATDRFETVSTSVTTTSTRHTLTLSLVAVVTMGNVGLAGFIWRVCGEQWATTALLLHDSFTLACSLLQLGVQYAVHLYEAVVLSMLDNADMPSGEWRRSLVHAVDTVTEIAVDAACMAHGLLLYWMHGLSLGVIDVVLLLWTRAIFAGLVARVMRLAAFIAVARNLRRSYEDVSPIELARVADTCAVCRETLHTGAKRLPCGHVFHGVCLRRWLEVKTACPVCRCSL